MYDHLKKIHADQTTDIDVNHAQLVCHHVSGQVVNILLSNMMLFCSDRQVQARRQKINEALRDWLYQKEGPYHAKEMAIAEGVQYLESVYKVYRSSDFAAMAEDHNYKKEMTKIVHGLGLGNSGDLSGFIKKIDTLHNDIMTVIKEPTPAAHLTTP